MATKTKPRYEPVAPPDGWEPEKSQPPVIIKRPLISINLSSDAAKTFGRFLICSAVTAACEAVAYLGIAAMVSQDRIIGVETKTLEVPIHASANPFTFYPALLIVLAAIYVVVIALWWFNRD